MEAKKIYLLSWAGWDHPEWNVITDEEQKNEILREIDEHNWVRPDILMFDVELLSTLADFLGKLRVYGLLTEDVRQKLSEILEKLENC